MKKKYFLPLLFLFYPFVYSHPVNANYWLIIGTYRQGPGGRPEVSGITSPSLYSIPMRDLDTCNERLQMKYINLFGSLIVNGLVYIAEIKNKFTFLHRVHNHLLYNFYFRKNHFLFQNKPLIKQRANLI